MKSYNKFTLQRSEGATPTNKGLAKSLVLHSTRIGIEVEVEGVRRDRIPHMKYWDCKDDGSLRNNGIEFVSCILWGDHIISALEELEAVLLKCGCDFSERTSIHVHMNVRDFTPERLRVLVATYSAVEPLLFEFAGRERLRNIFCVPITSTHLYRNLFNGTPKQSFTKNRYLKYMALNFIHIQDYGTVEFRHMRGNMDKQRIVNWINLLFRLKKHAYSHRDVDRIVDEITELNTTSKWEVWLTKVFGKQRELLGNDLRKVRDNIVTIKHSLEKESEDSKKDKASIFPKRGSAYNLLVLPRHDCRTSGYFVSVPSRHYGNYRDYVVVNIRQGIEYYVSMMESHRKVGEPIPPEWVFKETMKDGDDVVGEIIHIKGEKIITQEVLKQLSAKEFDIFFPKSGEPKKPVEKKPSSTGTATYHKATVKFV